MENFHQEISVGIIGLGPRGLSIFERFLCFASLSEHASLQFLLYLFDPGVPGVGVHTTDQKDFILLNTPVYLPTIFPGDIFENSLLKGEGLSFQDWFEKIYRPSSFYQVKEHSLQPLTYLPRRLLGEYLNWAYNSLIKHLPVNVKIQNVPEEAISISKQEGHYLVTTKKTGFKLEYLFVAIGHAERSNQATEEISNILKNPYPLEKRFSDSSLKKIAVAGMGLVAFDVISSCTVGRCGRFSRNYHNQLVYQRSGLEPIIYLFSKSGIPYSARPLEEEKFRYKPIQLTRETVFEIRKEKNKLDFHQDILPLLLDDVSICYYLAFIRNHEGSIAVNHQYELAKQAAQKNILGLWLKEKEACFGEFDPKTLIYPNQQSFTSAKSYHEWFISYLKKDIKEAREGIASPLKWAAEALLLAREGIREAVEFDGLTFPSLHDFFIKISPIINRNSIGPELQRIEELLALIEEGIVDLSLGPNPKVSLTKEGKVNLVSSFLPFAEVEVDQLCEAYLKVLPLERWASSLVRSMIAEGIIQSNSSKYPGLIGVQVDRSFRAIPRDPKEKSNVWVIGIMCEGTTYYNNYVPITWQGMPSTPFVEVHKAVSSFFSCVASSIKLQDSSF